VAFFGEGASNQGSFHESLNWRRCGACGVVRLRGQQVRDFGREVRIHRGGLERRSRIGLCMPGVLVGQNDALEVYEAAGAAIARARRGEGPTLLEVRLIATWATSRVTGDLPPRGRGRGVAQNDPIPRLGAHLRKLGLLDDAGRYRDACAR